MGVQEKKNGIRETYAKFRETIYFTMCPGFNSV